MSFKTWIDNVKGLGIVSLGYDLDKCWRASRAETKRSMKRKMLRIIDKCKKEDDYTVADYIKDEIERL